MRRQLLPALGVLIVLSVITGFAYPFLVTGAAQAAFGNKANGSLLKNARGTVIGSEWIGQPFTAAKYFHPRPQADAYVPGAQGGGTYAYGSNYGPLEPRLVGNISGVNIEAKRNPYATPNDPYCLPVEATDEDGNAIITDNGDAVYDKNSDGTYVCNPDTIPQRVLAYRAANRLPSNAAVPVDAVTASGSGLDPHISVANARIQARRVARVRQLPLAAVLRLVNQHTATRALGFLGEPGVNVLQLNLALDRL